MKVNRRGFVSGFASALAYAGIRPPALLAQAPAPRARAPYLTAAAAARVAEYDPAAKLSAMKTLGSLDSVMKAMTNAWKYANRYGYPDGDIVQAIATHHGVKPENILLGAGSGEILDVTGTTFLLGGKKVLGCDPTYGSVYQHATAIKADAIKVGSRPTTRRTSAG
jgi:histidinol-phosphate aminotransferase